MTAILYNLTLSTLLCLRFWLLSSDAPINIESNYIKNGTGLNSTISLQCKVCAKPQNVTYEWKANGNDLRDGITGQGTDTITIHEVAESDFTNYSCSATNIIGTLVLWSWCHTVSIGNF